MESGYDWSRAVHASDLAEPAAVGRSAGERAVKRLGPVKPDTAVMPVVFEQRLAGGLVGAIAGAINGAAVARGTSFLKDAMGEAVLKDAMNLIDDPGRGRGLGSRPFDAEGLPCKRRALVEGGVLRSWLLDLRSARQLGLEPTGHASRSAGSAPGPASSNLYLEPGRLSPEALIGEIENGLFVTALMGHGVDLVAGRYSQGAAGFAIRGGEARRAGQRDHHSRGAARHAARPRRRRRSGIPRHGERPHPADRGHDGRGAMRKGRAGLPFPGKCVRRVCRLC